MVNYQVKKKKYAGTKKNTLNPWFDQQQNYPQL